MRPRHADCRTVLMPSITMPAEQATSDKCECDADKRVVGQSPCWRPVPRRSLRRPQLRCLWRTCRPSCGVVHGQFAVCLAHIKVLPLFVSLAGIGGKSRDGS